MSELSLILSKNPVFYVTRDIERALGLSPQTEGYFIISNSTPFSKQIALENPHIFLLEENHVLDTHELLTHPKTIQWIKQHSQHTPHILVFKNTGLIEKICTENNWKLLNPSAKLSQTIEEKITQIDWLQELTKYLPPHSVKTAKQITFQGFPFILQFNRAHTGLGTMLIDSESILHSIQEKFPDRPVRVTEFIDGPMLTSNNIVSEKNIFVGNISYQITGIPPFTDNPFTTIGNDWALPKKLLNKDLKKQYCVIATEIGNKLRESGWKGLFGIDVIWDTQAQKLYLIEINARQPASTTYESILQKTDTIFEAHMCALLGASVHERTEIVDGAQIIIRNTPAIQNKNQNDIIQKIKNLNFDFTLIPYTNTEPGSDWIRIQSPVSLLENHNTLNEQGVAIKNILV